jgi:hypothetical protein
METGAANWPSPVAHVAFFSFSLSLSLLPNTSATLRGRRIVRENLLGNE